MNKFKFKKGDCLTPKHRDNIKIVWKVISAQQDSYVLKSLKYFGGGFDINSIHSFTKYYIENSYKICSYEKVVASVI